MKKQIAHTTVDLYPAENPKFKSRVLLVHGLWCGSECWAQWATRLSNLGWDCWAANLGRRALGRQAAGFGRLMLNDYVEEVKQVIQAAGPYPVMVTHDMGWLPTLKAAQEEKLAGLILISPPRAVDLPEEAARPLRLLRLKYLWVLLLGWPVRVRQKDFCLYWLSGLRDESRKAAATNLVPESSHMVKLLFQPSIPKVEGLGDLPTLVIGGTEDAVAPIASVRQTARALRAECREYRGYGHWMLAEEGWEEIVNDCHRWLVQELGETVLLNPP